MEYNSERIENIILDESNSKYMSAGINDNVIIVSATADKTVNGTNYIEIKFQKDEATHSEKILEKRKFEDMTEEQYQDSIDKQFLKIDQILKVYYPEKNDRKFCGNNFVEFAEWVVEKINNADLSKKLRLKLVYDNNGYTNIPKYSKFTFIEEMCDKDKSKIAQLSFDNFTKPIVADKELQIGNTILNDNNFNMESSVEDDMNLPF